MSSTAIILVILGIIVVGEVLGMIFFSRSLKRMRNPPPPIDEKKPEEKKKKKTGQGFGWVAIATVIVIVTLLPPWWWLIHYHVQRKSKTPTMIYSGNTNTPEYEFYWKLPQNVYVNSRNEIASDERLVEMIRLDDSQFWLNQHYVEYGRPEIMRIRLERVGDKSWEGTWEQDNPENHGRMNLDEITPGVYAGDRTWKNGERGRCYIKRK